MNDDDETTGLTADEADAYAAEYYGSDEDFVPEHPHAVTGMAIIAAIVFAACIATLAWSLCR